MRAFGYETRCYKGRFVVPSTDLTQGAFLSVFSGVSGEEKENPFTKEGLTSRSLPRFNSLKTSILCKKVLGSLLIQSRPHGKRQG